MMSETQPTYQSTALVGYGPAAAHPTPYDILLRQSRLLGRTAARATRTPHIAHTARPSGAGWRARLQGETEQKFFERHPDTMHKVVEESQNVLASARTVILPHNIFPDTVVIDRMKVTIILWRSLWLKEVVTLRIEDVMSVTARFGLFFGSLTISSRIMNSANVFQIEGFKNSDAQRLKFIIQGFMIAVQHGIDTSDLSTERLARKLYELGSDPAGMVRRM